MNKPREKWYRQNGAEGDVVISTRVRLARNLTGVPFPASMNPEQKQSVVEAVCAALQPVEETFQLADMGKLSPRDALSLVERHLISPEFARSGAGSALLLTEDEGTALMVNEEDHLRLQVMRPGLDLDGAYEQADRLDTVLDETLHFAFDQRLGYLTQCPTNLGTGMRASLMLHLPALQERGAIQQLAVTVSKLGLTIRGMYGEGTKPQGAIYQLSNQVTLGISEREVWRSLGLLRTARLLTGDEFMALMSNLRVGVAMGVIPGIPLETAGALINDVQPATLMAAAGRDMEPAERDALRARIVRERLA